jgi:hypothetical protein
VIAACWGDPAVVAPGTVALICGTPMRRIVFTPAIIGLPYTAHVDQNLSNVVGWYVECESDTAEASRRAQEAKAVRDLPVYAYLGGFVPTAIIPHIDVPCLQAYSLPGCESPQAVAGQLEVDIARCGYAPDRQAWAVECTSRKLPGFARWTTAQRVWFLNEIVRLADLYHPVAVFAWAWERQTIGMSACPELAAVWRTFVAKCSEPKPVPPQEKPMQAYSEDAVKAFGEVVRQQYREANREPDDEYPVWTSRTVYDYCAGMTWASSCEKHLWELRVKLGLPVGPQPVPV